MSPSRQAPFRRPFRPPFWPPALLAALLAAVLALGTPPLAQAQSSCASDGQPQPVALLERFISADCDTCWSDPATPKAGKGELAIDWVVPGQQGDDAPLSAVAVRDALYRLQALARPAPERSDSLKTPVPAASRTTAQRLRVAHGLPFNGYLGTSIALTPPPAGPLTAWLLLVETLPEGAEGSPVERHLVRNALQPSWSGRAPLTAAERRQLVEARPMGIPAGANPEHLRVVGWVQDAQGRMLSLAASRCAR